jgi:hypothetical protein
MPQPAEQPSELHKLQFDYAWKWFNFHADQRTKVFNFMLIVVGILAAGIINSLDKHLPNTVYALLCFTGGSLALIFWLLDWRNRYLLWLAEDVLRYLERERIFGKDVKIEGLYGENHDLGILWRQALEDSAAREKIQNDWRRKPCVPMFIWIHDAWRGKHRVWFPVVSWLIALSFFMAGFFALKGGLVPQVITTCPTQSVLPSGSLRPTGP